MAVASKMVKILPTLPYRSQVIWHREVASAKSLILLQHGEQWLYNGGDGSRVMADCKGLLVRSRHCLPGGETYRQADVGSLKSRLRSARPGKAEMGRVPTLALDAAARDRHSRSVVRVQPLTIDRRQRVERSRSCVLRSEKGGGRDRFPRLKWLGTGQLSDSTDTKDRRTTDPQHQSRIPPIPMPNGQSPPSPHF